MFVAASGVGKSTQAELWRRFRGAQIVNGDRAVVRREADGVFAYGIPFCGSSGICMPARSELGAMVVLSQGECTSILRLSQAQAFRAIWKECGVYGWSSRDVQEATAALEEIVGQVPVYHLCCTPDETAVKALENML